MKITKPGRTLALVTLFAGRFAIGQTNLNFNGVSATLEGAIRLSWNSTANEVYEIDYATELVYTNTGMIIWLPLYTDYPSHGTNTFIADAGEYDFTPGTVHPKYSATRFYRVALLGTNTSPNNPAVSITYPSNGATLSSNATIVVSSSSGEVLTDVRLYIDGELQLPSSDLTNFPINTCEWPNGPHVLFAGARSQSALSGPPHDTSITFGRAVSAYVNVTFSNLITRFAFSEPFFEPALGQTQRVSAVFAAGVDWTLQIQNDSTNVVRFASGNGASMAFDWDGTGTNGVSLPNGVYTYLLTVQTNGQSYSQSSAGGGGDSDPPPAPESLLSTTASDASSDTWYPRTPSQAIAAGLTSYFIDYPPLPPYKSNEVWIIPDPQPPVEVQIPNSVQARYAGSLSAASASEPSSPNGASAYGGPSGQATRGPGRPPAKPVKGEVGTFGICYDTYPDGFTTDPPTTGWISPLHTHVAIDGYVYTARNIPFWSLPDNAHMANQFKAVMEFKDWKGKLFRGQDQWTAKDIKKGSLGGNSIFNTVNFGMLITHGSYATDTENDNIKYTYIWVQNKTNSPSVEYARLSDLSFGSPGTNGQRWMTVVSCNTMAPANTSSMGSSRMPVSSDLHLLMGCETKVWMSQKLGLYYATDLVISNTIANSWYDAGQRAYQQDPPATTDTLYFRIAGWQDCFNDTLMSYSDPDPNDGLKYDHQKVYPFP